MFDFNIVKRQIISAYAELDKNDMVCWELEEVIKFFEFYYGYYEAYFYESHPRMKQEKMKWCIYYLSHDDSGNDYVLEDYEELVPQYFKTTFKNCNYSLVHFLSGDIRMMRFYETLY